jgi:hypothetical protein
MGERSGSIFAHPMVLVLLKYELFSDMNSTENYGNMDMHRCQLSIPVLQILCFSMGQEQSVYSMLPITLGVESLTSEAQLVRGAAELTLVALTVLKAQPQNTRVRHELVLQITVHSTSILTRCISKLILLRDACDGQTKRVKSQWPANAACMACPEGSAGRYVEYHFEGRSPTFRDKIP